jgi:hypothetical protein
MLLNILLTDDSNTTSLTRFIGENRVFYIISGSNGSAYTPSAATGPSYYGMMFPDLGVIIVLDASASSVVDFRNSFAPLTTATSSLQNNHVKLYDSIVSGSVISGTFQLRSSETVIFKIFLYKSKK